MPDNGVIYIATGEMYVKEARRSADQLKSIIDVDVTLFTDTKINGGSFDNVVTIGESNSGFAGKVELMRKTPYEKTIFLDTDTYVVEDISGIFDLLENFDICIAQNEKAYGFDELPPDHRYRDIPPGFPEFNTGVIGFKMSSELERFLDEWLDLFVKDKQGQYYESDVITDQQSFRVALYKSDLRHNVLPMNYNCVFRRCGYLNGKVKLFHGRLLDFEGAGASKNLSVQQAVEELNRRSEPRIYYRTIDGRVKIHETSLYTKVFRSLVYDGMGPTVKRVKKLIKELLP